MKINVSWESELLRLANSIGVEMAIRYVRFNVEALQEIAAMTLGAAYCTSMTKTHEGMRSISYFSPA